MCWNKTFFSKVQKKSKLFLKLVIVWRFSSFFVTRILIFLILSCALLSCVIQSNSKCVGNKNETTLGPGPNV